MAKLFIVIDKKEDWHSFYPSENVITAEEYLGADPSPEAPSQVINLCRSYRYLSKGYYCSLLAEARGDRVFPSVRTINDLSRRCMYALNLPPLDKLINKKAVSLVSKEQDRYSMLVKFGQTEDEELQELARQVFNQFPCPVLEITFKRVAQEWTIEGVRPFSINQLSPKQEDFFAAALDRFSRKVWRKARKKKRYSYDLAMLCNPEEKFPPSGRKALEQFVRAGRNLGIHAELIGKKDYARLPEYDALFIRETTAVNHHTYQFAQKAEFENMPVIDSPDSIMKCANKVYLAELMQEKEIPVPKTIILYKDRPDLLARAAEELGFPLVLKIPDGSFSRGVHKAATAEELQSRAREMFQESVLILAQEFMYTDFDWRIGVIGNRPLFACQYFMSKGHWQIYNHAARGSAHSGAFTTMAVEQAPAEVIKTALKVTGFIGNGLYGVDIKQQGDRIAVIEVNDNPNIDAGVEDQYLGPLLYHRVMEHFFMELERVRFQAR